MVTCIHNCCCVEDNRTLHKWLFFILTTRLVVSRGSRGDLVTHPAAEMWPRHSAWPSQLGASSTSFPLCLLLSEAWGWCYPRSHQHLTLPARYHLCSGCCLQCWSTWFLMTWPWGLSVQFSQTSHLDQPYHEVMCV